MLALFLARPTDWKQEEKNDYDKQDIDWTTKSKASTMAALTSYGS